MATRLQLYNKALRLCKEPKLASLAEDREPRRLLDQVWDEDCVTRCLEAANWYFAVRTQRKDYDPSVDTDFGYQYAFNKPTDWVSTVAVSLDEHFNTPLTAYEDEDAYWWADGETLYVRYVSNDSAWGGDPSRWSASFLDYIAAYMAKEIIGLLTTDNDREERIVKRCEMEMKKAKSHNAKQGPTRFPPEGSWNLARRGYDRGDRGSNSNLIG